MKHLFLLMTLVLSGCSLDVDNPDQVFCTEQFVYGLNVTVRDSSDNTIITEDITVIARDGTYEEELAVPSGFDVFIGAGERPGNYIIEVTSDNYQTYTSETIQVDADICHVIPRFVEILLTPN